MAQTKRKYELKARAERQAETRRRITEATVALHEEVGPARTQISEIARRAGVQRLTVYSHFPTERELFAACSQHWEAAHPPPDLQRWRSVEDPRERTEGLLRELYGYYDANAQMLAHVMRDAEAIEPLREVVDEGLLDYVEGVAEVLADGWGRPEERVSALIALVVRFESWEHLARRGHSPDAAAALVASLAAAAARADC